MSRIVFPRAVPKNFWGRAICALALVVAILVAFHQYPPARPSKPAAPDTSVDLEEVLGRAFAVKQPVILLVIEAGRSPADDEARALLESPEVKAKRDRAITVLLDMSVARTRAVAARFHVMATPLLLCLSSRGIIVSRDEKPVAQDLLLQRIDEVAQQAPEVDAKFAALVKGMGTNPKDADAQFALTDFLLAHHNAFEAIPHLEGLAHAKANAPAVRIRAWVDLARAHYWIGEAEKGRHEAEDLLTTLGSTENEARAGGNLVLGLHDAEGKRMAAARREFGEAITAAPESSYGRQAAGELAKLPKE